MSDDSWLAFLNSEDSKGHLSYQQEDHKYHSSSSNSPKYVKLVPRFIRCLDALNKFFKAELPPVINTWTKNVSLIVYGFVDVSKPGFGSIMDTCNK